MSENTSTTGDPRAMRRPPLPAWDGPACKAAFEQSSASRPWTLGYRSMPQDRLSADDLRISGRIPPGLRGVFYRNGPALHERGGWRYGHRWDGDGMVQAFWLREGSISHRGAMVRTDKFEREESAGRMLVSAFGTHVPGSDAVPARMDDLNSANIGVIRVGQELLALWEPGSAYVLDPLTLETHGPKTWSEATMGAPFSAHPRREPEGGLWNFGVDPLAGWLHVYRIDAGGPLLRHHRLQFPALPPVHDFAITDRHLVFVLPSLRISAERLHAGVSFAEACAWRPDVAMEALAIDKDDFSIRRWELPPGYVFHIGNAWEDRQGVIRLDMMRADAPNSLISGWSVMRGEYRHTRGASFTLVELHPGGTVRQVVLPEPEGEFPVVDPSEVGRRYGQVLFVGRSAERAADVPGFDEVLLADVDSVAVQRFRYGHDWLVEEHLLVPDASDPGGPARWIIGTALDLQQQVSAVSVFDARSLESGPVARCWLPYPLPLGLHGRFEPDR